MVCVLGWCSALLPCVPQPEFFLYRPPPPSSGPTYQSQGPPLMRGCRGEVPPSLEALGKGECAVGGGRLGHSGLWARTATLSVCGVSRLLPPPPTGGGRLPELLLSPEVLCVSGGPSPGVGTVAAQTHAAGKAAAVTPAQVGGAWPGLHPQAGRGRLLERMSRSLPVPSLIPGPTLLLHNWEQGAWLSLPGLWTEGGCICMLICMRSS